MKTPDRLNVQPHLLRALLVTMVIASALVISQSPAQAAATATFKKGTLSIRGTSGADQPLEVYCSGGNLATQPNLASTIACTKLKRVSIYGGGGGDIINTKIGIAESPNLISMLVNAGGGDDTIQPGPFKETLIGGSGSDFLNPGAISVNATLTDTKMTGQGVDTLQSIEEARLSGSGGDDTIDATGFTGETTMDGNAGNDTIRGGSGPDSIGGGTGNDALFGNKGDDVLDQIDGYGADSSDGDDTFSGGPGTDTVAASGAGNMTATSTTLAGTGSDTLANIEEVVLITNGVSSALNASTFPGFSKLISLSPNGTTFSAGLGGSIMRGDAGADTFIGQGGLDEVWLFDNSSATLTNAGLTSPQGNDTFTSIDSAWLRGTPAANTLNASAFSGPVTFDGEGGLDTLTGGANDDFFLMTYGGTMNGGGGTDAMYTNVGAMATLTNTLFQNTTVGTTNTTLSSIESAEMNITDSSGSSLTATAFSGPITVDGNDGSDVILSGGADDILHGWGGDDTLNGGGGDDVLNGGGGTDDCTGGPGTDTIKKCE